MATGTAYCHVVLIGENKESKRVQTTQGARYNDEYIKIDGEWKIVSRTSHFVYTDTKGMQQHKLIKFLIRQIS